MSSGRGAAVACGVFLLSILPGPAGASGDPCPTGFASGVIPIEVGENPWDAITGLDMSEGDPLTLLWFTEIFDAEGTVTDASFSVTNLSADVVVAVGIGDTRSEIIRQSMPGEMTLAEAKFGGLSGTPTQPGSRLRVAIALWGRAFVTTPTLTLGDRQVVMTTDDCGPAWHATISDLSEVTATLGQPSIGAGGGVTRQSQGHHASLFWLNEGIGTTRSPSGAWTTTPRAPTAFVGDSYGDWSFSLTVGATERADDSVLWGMDLPPFAEMISASERRQRPRGATT